MYQIVCDSAEQETLAYGEESFLNNLVKMFKLPALTLALGRGLAACSWLSDRCGCRSKEILWLHRAGERGMQLSLPSASATVQHLNGTVLKPSCHLSKCLSGQHWNVGAEAAAPL